MPSVQTTYGANHPVAFEGMIANIEPQILISRTVETAAIGFGRAVKQGTADYGVQAAAADGEIVRGITVRDQSTKNAGTPDEIAVGESALIMTQGVIWVRAGGAVEAGNPVFMAVADGDFVDTDAGTDLPIPGAIFETSGADGDLVAIRLTGTV